MSTGTEHYREAERLLDSAEHWLNADTGWQATMPVEERFARRDSDVAAAQAHAILALVVALARLKPPGKGDDR